MNYKLGLALACAVSFSSYAVANPGEIRVGGNAPPISEQMGRTAPTEQVAATPAPDVAYLPAGTMLQLTPLAEITSKRIEEGDKVGFSVVSDVVEDGKVAIPRGATVQATVTWKTGRAIGGKSGKFEVKFDSVNVRGRNYAMKGMYRQEGRGNTVGALLGSIIISGRSAVMLPGDLCNAFTDAPIPYS